MVLVQEYDPTLDLASLQYKATSVWVDLISVHPLLEIQATKLLAMVGQVIHTPLLPAEANTRTYGHAFWSTSQLTSSTASSLQLERATKELSTLLTKIYH
jgi:hypothetical protein